MGVRTLFYTLMPAGRLPLRHALVGGIAAAQLCCGREYAKGYCGISPTCRWYNVVYGSLTGVTIALLSLEAASLIILLVFQPT